MVAVPVPQSQEAQRRANTRPLELIQGTLQESAAVLEQHHLSMTRKPALLEPTSSEKLVYLDPPAAQSSTGLTTLLAQVNPRQILPGY